MSPSKSVSSKLASKTVSQTAQKATAHKAEPKPAGPKLADFLCFAIYSANLAYGRAYKPILDPLGLTYTQYIALVALWEEDGQTVSQLGERMFLESNTLTPILKKLESLGYLHRRRDSDDERVVRVSLTDEGRRLRERAAQRNLVKASGFPLEDFVKLQKQVTKLRDNLLDAVKAGEAARGDQA